METNKRLTQDEAAQYRSLRIQFSAYVTNNCPNGRGGFWLWTGTGWMPLPGNGGTVTHRAAWRILMGLR